MDFFVAHIMELFLYMSCKNIFLINLKRNIKNKSISIKRSVKNPYALQGSLTSKYPAKQDEKRVSANS